MTNDSNVSTIRAGRRAERFVQTPEWIVVSGLSAQAQALYTALLAHVNRKQGDGIAWPGMSVLAQILGYRKRQSITPYLNELAALGAIQIVKVPCPSGQRNEYVVHEIPPPSYLGFRDLAAFYADRRKREAEERMSARADIARSAVAYMAESATADMNQTDGPTGTDVDESASSSGHTPVGTSPAVSLPQHASASGIRRIRIPRYFYTERWTDKEVRQYLVGAAIKAMEDAGLVVDDRAAQAIGHALKHKFAHLSRRQLVDIVKKGVKGAGDPDDPNCWLGQKVAA